MASPYVNPSSLFNYYYYWHPPPTLPTTISGFLHDTFVPQLNFHFLVSYLWNDYYFNPDVFSSVSNFISATLQEINFFIGHFFKPGKPESPSGSIMHIFVLFAWTAQLVATFHHRSAQARNKCPLCIRKGNESFVRCRAERLLSSAEYFCPFSKPSRNFCSSNFPLICNATGDPNVNDKRGEDFCFRFVFCFTLLSCSVQYFAVQLLLFLVFFFSFGINQSQSTLA